MNNLIVSALLLASPSELLPESPERSTSVRVDIPAVPDRPDAAICPAQESCPVGQFASAFPDVYPTDWDYEQVNNLASASIECFDWPSEPTSSP